MATGLKMRFFFYLFQSCDNDPINFDGLHESIVDSDEDDIADSIDVSYMLGIIPDGTKFIVVLKIFTK